MNETILSAPATPENMAEMSDRDLLEFIARNVAETRQDMARILAVAQGAQEQVAPLLAQFANSPALKMLSRLPI